MFINGINSLNSNAQPLFVIDGVVYDMLYDSEMLHFGYWNNLLSTINMDDVEAEIAVRIVRENRRYICAA